MKNKHTQFKTIKYIWNYKIFSPETFEIIRNICSIAEMHRATYSPATNIRLQQKEHDHMAPALTQSSQYSWCRHSKWYWDSAGTQDLGDFRVFWLTSFIWLSVIWSSLVFFQELHWGFWYSWEGSIELDKIFVCSQTLVNQNVTDILYSPFFPPPHPPTNCHHLEHSWLIFGRRILLLPSGLISAITNGSQNTFPSASEPFQHRTLWAAFSNNPQ